MFIELPGMQDITILKLFNRRYGNALVNALMTAQGKEERLAVWDWINQHEAKLKAEGND
jgi:hypothetical protein